MDLEKYVLLLVKYKFTFEEIRKALKINPNELNKILKKYNKITQPENLSIWKTSMVHYPSFKLQYRIIKEPIKYKECYMKKRILGAFLK